MRRNSEGLFTAPAAIKVGSFRLRRPAGEQFVGGIGDTVYQVLSGVPPRRAELEGYLQGRARAGLTDDDTLAFRDFLLRRADGAGERLLLAGTDYLTNVLNGYVTDRAQGLGFVNQVEIDFQTPLGKRRGSGGLSALGALRATERDAIIWQLRGYVAEEDGKGANAGLIYRRAAKIGVDSLFGGNVFVDFEKHGDSGENFLRWSVGGEYRNAYLDFTANRYFAISDAVVVGDETYYTAEGIDAELNVNLLNRAAGALSGSLSGGLGYYNWEGIQGDADDEGLRYHLRFLPGGGNLHLELQFDVPEEGDEEWGGRVAYRHVINAAQRGGGGNLGGAERDFDARGHFFDAARREYAQRIRRVQDSVSGDAIRAAAITGNIVIAATAPGAAAAVLETVTLGGAPYRYSREAVLSISIQADSTLSLAAGEEWGVIGYPQTEFHITDASRVLSLTSGTVFVSRRNGELTLSSPSATLALFGTRVLFKYSAAGAVVEVYEGRVSIQAADAAAFDDLSIAFPQPGATLAPPAIQGIVADLPQPATNLMARAQVSDGSRMLMLDCDSAEGRAHQRLFDDEFEGCEGDLLIGGLAASETVILTGADGKVTLTGSDGGASISVASALAEDGVKWGRYPFSAGGLTMVVGNDDIALSYGVGTAMTAAVEVAGGSTVEFYSDTAAAQPAAARMVTALVRHGRVFAIDGTNEVLCSDSDKTHVASQTDEQLMVVAFCGTMIAEATGNPAKLIAGRITSTVTRTYDFDNGGEQFRFELNPVGGALTLKNTVGMTATVELISEQVAGELFDEASYTLVTRPPAALSGLGLAALSLTLTTRIYKAFSANAVDVAEGEPVVFRTLLDGTPNEYAVLTVEFIALGEITYASSNNPTFNGQATFNGTPGMFAVDLPGPGSDDEDKFVTIRVSEAFDEETTITVSLVAEDDFEGLVATVTAVFTLQARHPGAIGVGGTSYVGADTDGDGYYEYSRMDGQPLATLTGVTNAIFSGLAADGNYEYMVTGPAGFTAGDGAGSDDQRGIVSLDYTGTPPAQGEHTVTVVIKDGHGNDEGDEGSPHLTVMLKVELMDEPLAVEVSGELAEQSDRLLADDKVLFTVAASGGFGSYTYMVDSDDISVDAGGGGEVQVDGEALFFANTAVFTVSVADEGGNSAEITVSLGFSEAQALVEAAGTPTPALAGAVLLTIPGRVSGDTYELVSFTPEMQTDFTPAVASSVYLGLSVHSDGSARLVEAEAIPDPQTIVADVRVTRGGTVAGTVKVSVTWAADPDAIDDTINADKDILLMGGIGNSGDDIWIYENDAASWSLVTNVSPVGRLLDASPGLVGSDNRLFLFGGRALLGTNLSALGIWSSADGKDWNNESVSGFEVGTGTAAAFHEGSLYFMGGQRGQTATNTPLRNDVWAAAGDGSGWTERTDGVPDANRFEARSFYSAVSHRGSLYVIGGVGVASVRYGDVWVSSDGANWERLVQTDPFGARSGHAAVSFGGKIYVIGGANSQISSSTIGSDVWSSVDGKRWRRMTGKIQSNIDKIEFHSVFVRGNRMLLIGGIKRNGSSSVSDHLVYASSDGGKTWAVDNDLSNAGIGIIARAIIFLFDRPAP